MKKLLSVAAVVSLVLLSFDAHSRFGLNGLGANKIILNGVSLNGVDQTQTLNLRGLAQAPLVKAN